MRATAAKTERSERDRRSGSRAMSVEKALHRLEHLNEIAKLFASFETVEQTFDAALDVATKTLPLESAILVEDTGDNHRMTHWSPEGLGAQASEDAKAHAESVLNAMVGRGEGQQSRSENASRFIALPLVVANRPVIGVLQVEAAAFDRQDLVFVSAITSQFAVALDRDRAWRRAVARRDQAEAMTKTLGAQTEELLAADRQRTDLLSSLALDLRSSLGAMREVQQLMRGAPGGERMDRALSTMHLQIQRTAQLIDDLQGLSSLTRERNEVRKEFVEIGGILATAAEHGVDLMRERGQSLVVSLPAGTAYLEADAPRLGEILATLIEKASMLASPGARIWMTVRMLTGENARSSLPGGFDGPQVVVTLRDDGAGEGKSILPRVFDLFNPAGKPLDADARFGAGLKLTRRLVELHGGTVRATSSGFGQGSEFEVRLPIVTRHAAVLGPERRSS